MNHPWIIVRQDSLEGSDGRTRALPAGEPLPAPLEIVRALGSDGDPPGKLGILLEDALLHPLRITLEEKAPARDLSRFLAWKLKRFLPFSADTAEIRHLPLPEDGTHLTFSMPGSWLQKLMTECDRAGVHCGYVGGLFTTLLENAPVFRDRAAIALFDDCYLFARLDRQGRYQDFRLRRLPGSEDRIDLDILVGRDWQPLAASDGPPTLLCDLRRQHDADLGSALHQHGLALEAHQHDGPLHQRFLAWLGGVA